jgi:hypothetical protein
MYKLVISTLFGLLLFSNTAMALCSSYPYTLTNGTTADATQVMADFSCAALTQGATLDNASFTSSASFLTPIALVRPDASHAASVNFKTAGANQWSIGMDPIAGVAGDLMFYNVATNSTQMILKGNGVSGIGTANPAGVFEVQKNQNATTEFYFTNNDSTNSSSRAAINLVGGSRTLQLVAIQSDHEYVNYTNGTNLYFDEGPNIRLEIQSGGNVGIGTASPSYLLTVNGTAYATGAAGALSDVRHKKNIVALPGGALNEVMRLRPVSFLWKEPRDEGMKGRQTGFIAQEVEQVLPSVVLTQSNTEKTKGLKYNELIAVLAKALQEEQVEIDSLKSEVRSQTASVSVLEQKVRYLTSERTVRTAQR